MLWLRPAVVENKNITAKLSFAARPDETEIETTSFVAAFLSFFLNFILYGRKEKQLIMINTDEHEKGD